MPTNLTGNTVSSTYDQLLHVDGGPTATEKTVYGGTGVATALKVSTGAVSVDNIKLDGNTVSSTNTDGNIVLSPNGTGTVSFSKAAITGGTITGVGLSGLSADLPIADGGTGASTASAARTNLGIGTNGTFDAVYGFFYSDVDQTYSANTPAVVTFSQSAPFNVGISVASSSRITMTVAGVYEISFTGQLYNADSTDHAVTIWFRKNGTDIAASATKLAVPKIADSGVHIFTITGMEQFTAGQYIEAVVMVDNANVKLDYTAAAVGPPAVPAIPSALINVTRIG